MTADAAFSVDDVANDHDWYEWRRHGIGGSDIAAILGLSPWQSPYGLWLEKVGATTVDRAATEAMEFGKLMEPVIATWFHNETGLYIVGQQQCVRADRSPVLRATLDGWVADADDPDPQGEPGRALSEFKVTRDTVKEWDEAGIPDNYRAQVTWQSVVTGCRHIYVIVLHLAYGRPQLRWYEYDVPDSDAEWLERTALDWWQRHVVTGDPPDVDAHPATTAALKGWRSDDPNLGGALPPALEVWAEIVVNLSKEIAQLERARDLARNKVRAAMGPYQYGELPGYVVKWPRFTKKAIDHDAIERDHPGLLDRYRTTTDTSRFSITPKKKE